MGHLKMNYHSNVRIVVWSHTMNRENLCRFISLLSLTRVLTYIQLFCLIVVWLIDQFTKLCLIDTSLSKFEVIGGLLIA